MANKIQVPDGYITMYGYAQKHSKSVPLICNWVNSGVIKYDLINGHKLIREDFPCPFYRKAGAKKRFEYIKKRI